MKVQQILDQIDSGDIALPEFQRGFVWNRDQVRSLFTSLYRGYPVGSFMTWNTAADAAAARGGVSTDGTIKLLLDGQQRGTSLYGVIRGHAPKFSRETPERSPASISTWWMRFSSSTRRQRCATTRRGLT